MSEIVKVKTVNQERKFAFTQCGVFISLTWKDRKGRVHTIDGVKPEMVLVGDIETNSKGKRLNDWEELPNFNQNYSLSNLEFWCKRRGISTDNPFIYPHFERLKKVEAKIALRYEIAANFARRAGKILVSKGFQGNNGWRNGVQTRFVFKSNQPVMFLNGWGQVKTGVVCLHAKIEDDGKVIFELGYHADYDDPKPNHRAVIKRTIEHYLYWWTGGDSYERPNYNYAVGEMSYTPTGGGYYKEEWTHSEVVEKEEDCFLLSSGDVCVEIQGRVNTWKKLANCTESELTWKIKTAKIFPKS